MAEYKLRYTDRIETKGNKIIGEQKELGFEPIQISYGTGFGGHGLAILFKKP